MREGATTIDSRGQAAEYGKRSHSLEASAESQTSEASRALGFRAGSCVTGEPQVPCSKSIAQRVLLCAALAKGETRISGLTEGEDVEAAVALLQRLGVCGEVAGELVVRGSDLKWPKAGEQLELGESGTLARFATAAAALCRDEEGEIELVPRGSLATRSSPALFEALRGAGARIVAPNGEATNGWPVRISAAHDLGALILSSPRSSQDVSGILIALAAQASLTHLSVRGAIPSLPYVHLTRAVIRVFGPGAEFLESRGETSISICGPLCSPGKVTIEPDASAAAVALAAACLSGGEVTLRGFGTPLQQGDARIVEHLRAAGCEAKRAGDSLLAGGAPHRAFELDLGGEPDLAPVLAAVGAYVAWHSSDSKPCILRGLETLPGKESSRIEVLARGLSKLGFDVEHDDKSLTIARGSAPERDLSTPTILDPANDHRMAFCFALCSLFIPNVFVSNPGCTSKSWPSFWSDLSDSGAKLETA